MLTRDSDAFLAFARRCTPDACAATAQAAFLVAPDGFALAMESAGDNRYMAEVSAFDPVRAQLQHRALQQALASELPVVCFAGDPATPDAVFPNNVFATARVGDEARLIVGRMRHAVRRREAERPDIRSFFRQIAGCAEIDLSSQAHACELTGALVIDRARGLGFCGLSERCDETGAQLMHEAFGLRATFVFDLAPGEYHTNVVLAVLAGRAVLICNDGFADSVAAGTIASLYAPHAVMLSPAERAAFAGNAIALSPDTVWMSTTADAALRPESRRALTDAGFAVRSVALDAIEAAGGSLRCCVGEWF